MNRVGYSEILVGRVIHFGTGNSVLLPSETVLVIVIERNRRPGEY